MIIDKFKAIFNISQAVFLFGEKNDSFYICESLIFSGRWRAGCLRNPRAIAGGRRGKAMLTELFRQKISTIYYMGLTEAPLAFILFGMMKKALFILSVIAIAVLAETDTTWDCIVANCLNLAPTQSVTGTYRWNTRTDSLEGRYLYVPPHTTYYTDGDTVRTLDFMSLKDPWFDWWIMRNPLRDDGQYETSFVKDSLAFLIYDHVSLSNEFSNVRVAYDRGSCEPFSALFYWPEEAGHGFPGAEAIYYEFYITDAITLAPSKRQYLNTAGEVVEEFIFETIESIRRTPADSVIIQKLLSDEKFD